MLITMGVHFNSSAQTTPAKPQPIPTRQVSGIVKDSTNQGVIGASVTLTSSADTLRGSTNEDGVFVFRNVKSWVFTLDVRSLGYVAKVISGKYNDATPRLTLDPIILKTDSRMLDAVIVNGTPSIVYKTDTTEYRASDYVVRAGATVDELLQKMEGMEVGNDGSVTVNGTAIAKARLNGKDIYGGDVATTIQNLPAEIVEKIQIVDDYGNTAARTGIKDGDPTKVLNITTKTEKSVGNMARLNFGVGTLDQLEASANITRINMNQTLTANGTFMQTPNGIAGGNSSVGRLGSGNNRGGRSGGGFGGGGSGSASGGTSLITRPSFTYRDKFGKKLDFLANYAFRYNDNNTITNSYSEFNNILENNQVEKTFTKRDADNQNFGGTHNINFELEYAIDSANFLQFRPTISLGNTDSENTSRTFQTGFIHQDQTNNSKITGKTPNISGTVAYQHLWLRKPGRVFSAEATIGRQKNDNESEQNNFIRYYDGASNNVEKDSTIHRAINTNNLQKNYRASLTYSEPLSELSRLEFNANVERRGYDNSKITSNIDNLNNRSVIDSLSNIFDYFFTQYRNSVNYKYGNNKSKYSFSLGLTGVNTSLVGEKVSLGTKTDQSYFKVIPIARFQLRLSSTHQLAVYYRGNANEPNFDQIQPVRDVSNPQRPIVGNPDLKAAFTHSVVGQYSNYIANSKLNYSVRVNSSITENQVSSNTVPIKDVYGSFKNETRYININGNNKQSVDYSISKQSSDRKYNLSLTGSIDKNRRVAMSNSVKTTSDTWGFKESLGPRINPTTWLEINPYISYDFNKTSYSIADGITQQIWSVSLDGNIYFLKNMQFGYALSKNYVSGINNNVTNNPFVINTMLQMKVFKNKGALQLRAYDLLNQNNFINRTTSDNGFTEIATNPNSRYVMLNLSMNLQKWTGAVGKKNQNIRRRGDGSFF
ncbi:TonB-dependent receptor [Pedobacter arcticus]|uniref:TonB-dependent receptor n=1 Tax=Pedobacter arcticus TaxID=752140 RepID=UPI000474AF90|nr:TonB-dependent receptor [Pedobacter arcticus]